jgi:signal transduction histidine kinase
VLGVAEPLAATQDSSGDPVQGRNRFRAQDDGPSLPCRSPLELAIDLHSPNSVEVGAYYVVSEALINAVKHSRAPHAAVRGHANDDIFSVSISDDGIGDADFGKGPGFIGLRDRVEPLRGRIRMVRPAGSGTSLDATFPLGAV